MRELKLLTHQVRPVRNVRGKTDQSEDLSKEIAASVLAGVDQITKAGNRSCGLYYITCIAKAVSFVGLEGAHWM